MRCSSCGARHPADDSTAPRHPASESAPAEDPALHGVGQDTIFQPRIALGGLATESGTAARQPPAPPPAPTTGPGAGDPGAEVGQGTIFHPEIALGSLLNEAADPTASGPPRDRAARDDEVTQRLPADAVPAPPPLPPGVEAYFLVLGAPPGRERLPLLASRTVLGRRGADIDLPDPTVSSRHCHIDVMGNEFFIRDLQTEGGTFLNGSRIRYTELVPGDEVRIGRTTLIFRTSRDGLSSRDP